MSQDETTRRMEHLFATLGPRMAVDMIARAISHLDVSRTARQHGDLGSAEAALDAARKLLVEVLGIQ